ncbi:MAG: hypothetical protein HN759_03310 [Akkermansiaceae bacterium]|nr:hypothetical protein [Akkermansiaceae bacterium]
MCGDKETACPKAIDELSVDIRTIVRPKKRIIIRRLDREIDEELNIAGGHSHQIVALLNDDSNSVGQVHLGVVHMVDLENAQVTANEDAIANLGFYTLEQLRGDLYEHLETWTQACVDTLEDL